MLLAKVTTIQFTADGDLAVRHLPTGNRYAVYPASNPDDFYVVCTVLNARITTSEQLYDAIELREAARPLLEQMLRQRRALSLVPKD